MKTKQKTIAEKFGYSQTYLSLVFNGKKSVSWAFAEKVSKLFHKDPDKWVTYYKNLHHKELKKLLTN